MPAFAATSAQIDAHRQAAADARKQAAAATKAADQLKVETEALDKQIAALQADVDALDPKIADATARTARLRDEVKALKALSEQKRTEIASTTAEYQTQQLLLSERVAATYRQGNLFYLDVLLGANNFSDLVTRTDLVGRVIRSNNDVAANLSYTRNNLERAKAELDRAIESAAAKKRESEAVQSQLTQMQNTRQSKVNASATVYKQKSDLMAENKQNAARLLAFAAAEEAEAARVAAILRARGRGSGIYNGIMLWPVDGGYVSSPYGWRIHPIFKTRKFHRGVDISAPMGSTVFAAGAGTVIKADYGWGGGYGNRVWIDHGNGVITTYNHLKEGSFRVSSGSVVKKGDQIANVGSTGYSTGPHLHFEVWINGETVDPMTYLQ
jgi:murein DD-endopeptidase MepM/ murein hydrolase activator NlpD